MNLDHSDHPDHLDHPDHSNHMDHLCPSRYEIGLHQLAEKRYIDVGGVAGTHVVHDVALLEPKEVKRQVHHHHHHQHQQQEHEENIPCLSQEKSRDKSMAQPIAIVQKRMSKM